MHASGRAVRSAGAPGGLELLERDFGQPSSRVVLCFCCFSSRWAGPLACAPVLLCRHAQSGLAMVLCSAGGPVHLGALCHWDRPRHASLQCWWTCTPWCTLSLGQASPCFFAVLVALYTLVHFVTGTGLAMLLCSAGGPVHLGALCHSALCHPCGGDSVADAAGNGFHAHCGCCGTAARRRGRK
jgi:hypothetical protein